MRQQCRPRGRTIHRPTPPTGRKRLRTSSPGERTCPACLRFSAAACRLAAGRRCSDRATDSKTIRPAREVKSGAKSDVTPAQAAIARAEVHDARPRTRRRAKSGDPGCAGSPDWRAGFHRIHREPGRAGARARLCRGRIRALRGSGIPVPASDDAPRFPAANGRRPPRRVFARSRSQLPPPRRRALPRHSVHSSPPKPPVSESADRQVPPVTPERGRQGCRESRGPAGLPLSAATAVRTAAGRTHRWHVPGRRRSGRCRHAAAATPLPPRRPSLPGEEQAQPADGAGASPGRNRCRTSRDTDRAW